MATSKIKFSAIARAALFLLSMGVQAASSFKVTTRSKSERPQRSRRQTSTTSILRRRAAAGSRFLAGCHRYARINQATTTENSH